MSKLNVSQTALDTAWRYFAKDAWLGLSETQKILSASPIQQAINSELDRIAGPLAEALAESLNELRRICKEPNWMIGVGSEVLENYRKERGE